MGRRNTREVAMKLLFQLELQKDEREEQINDILEQSELVDKEKDYVLDIVNGVSAKVKDIDNLIVNNSKGWKPDRMSKVDLSVLRLAIYELYYRNDIPASVSINEAIELVKKFSAEESGAFINGILGKINKSKNDNKTV